MGGKAPSPPNYAPLAAASLAQTQAATQASQESADIARQQLDVQKQAYDTAASQGAEYFAAYQKQQDQNQQYLSDVMPTVKAEMQSQLDTSQKAGTYLDTQIANANQAADQSKYLWDRYTNQLVPVQNQLIDYAKSQAPGTPAGNAYADQQAAAAKADVYTSMDAARVNADQQLRSYGIDPSQGRSEGLNRAQLVAEHAAASAAGTQSRIQSTTRGLSLLGAVNDMATGAPGQVAQALALTGPVGTAGFNAANTSGVAGVNAGLSATSTQSSLSPAASLGGLALNPYINALGPFGSSGSSLANTSANFFGQGTAAIGQSANILNTGFQNQMSEYNANEAALQNTVKGIGSLVGGGLGFALGGPAGALTGANIGGRA
jgi:hypothetical protein